MRLQNFVMGKEVWEEKRSSCSKKEVCEGLHNHSSKSASEENLATESLLLFSCGVIKLALSVAHYNDIYMWVAYVQTVDTRPLFIRPGYEGTALLCCLWLMPCA